MSKRTTLPKFLWCYREKGEPGMFASETVAGCVPAKKGCQKLVGHYALLQKYVAKEFYGVPMALPMGHQALKRNRH